MSDTWDGVLRCAGCDAPEPSCEWIQGTTAHETLYCWDDNAADFGLLCWACVDAWGLARCPQCHAYWADGALMRPDDVLTFAEAPR